MKQKIDYSNKQRELESKVEDGLMFCKKHNLLIDLDLFKNRKCYQANKYCVYLIKKSKCQIKII